MVRKISGRKAKICLYWDNARMHKAHLVQERAKDKDINIRLCFNLPYRPDLNPTELVFRRAKKEYRSQIERLKGNNMQWDQDSLVKDIFDNLSDEFVKR